MYRYTNFLAAVPFLLLLPTAETPAQGQQLKLAADLPSKAIASPVAEQDIVRGRLVGRQAAQISALADLRTERATRPVPDHDRRQLPSVESGRGAAQGSSVVKAQTPIVGNLTSPAPTQVVDAVTMYAGSPPDTNGAAGLSQLVTALNGGLWITPRAKGKTTFIDWPAFWTSVLPTENAIHQPFDPRIIYDGVANKYIVTAAYRGCDSTVCFKEGSLLIAASEGDDALAAWNLFRIPLDEDNQVWVDFPNTGHNATQVAVTLQTITVPNAPLSASGAAKILIFDKQGLYDPTYDVNTELFSIDWSTPEITNNVPAVMTESDSSDDFWLITSKAAANSQLFTFHNLNRQPGGSAQLDLGVSTVTTSLTRQSAFSTVNGQMGSTSSPICSGVQNGITRNGSVWFTTMATFDQNQTAVWGLQWLQVDPTTGSVLDSGSAVGDGQGHALLCPTLALNSRGDLLIGVSETSPDMYISASYLYRGASDPQSGLRELRQYGAGLAPHWSCDNGYCRIGDYSSAVIDPLDPTAFWVVQQYANSAGQGAASWAQVVPSGVDLRTSFDPACAPLSNCPVTVSNAGYHSAQGVSVDLGLSLGDSLTIVPPPGWVCRPGSATLTRCAFGGEFLGGMSATFTYAYQTQIAGALVYAIADSAAEDMNPPDNSDEHSVAATY